MPTNLAPRATFNYASQLVDSEGSQVAYKLIADSQIDTLVLGSYTNTEPDVGGLTKAGLFVRVTGTRKDNITARHVVIKRLIGTAPNQAQMLRKVPWLDPSTFYKAIIQEEMEISYQGNTDWVLIGATNERYRLPESESPAP